MTDLVVKEAYERGQYFINEVSSKRLLHDVGIPVVQGQFCRTTEEAVNFFEQIGGPVVAKVVSDKIIHKSDQGGVQLNLRSKDELVEACAQIQKNAGGITIDGFLVEQMQDIGLEVILGSFDDPIFGQVMMIGLGGIFTEVLKDVSFRALPISAYDAEMMIKDLQASSIFEGYRSIPKADLAQLIDIMLKIGGKDGFITKHSNYIKELDINPLVINKEGMFILDARLILKNKEEMSG